MMNRSSKAITLVLVGSTAALAGFGVLNRATHRAGDDSVQSSDFGPEEEEFVGDGSTQPSTRPGGRSRVHPVVTPGYSSNRYRTYRSTPIGRTGGSSGSSGNLHGSSSGSSSSSASSSSHGSGTSRGGFGSSGHAASSSS